MTKLALINYVFQLFFIRIYGSKKDGKFIGYGVLYWVVPSTGWFSPYIKLTKKVKGKRPLHFTKILWK